MRACSGCINYCVKNREPAFIVCNKLIACLGKALCQAVGKYVFGQFATDKNHLVVRFFFGAPEFSGFCTHEHVHALEQHSLFDAFHIQDALVTVKVGTKNLYHTTQEFFQALGIEGLAGGNTKAPISSS